MSVHRMFQMECDTCGNISEEVESYSITLKENLIKCGWKIGNKAKCPACLGTDPDYWESGWSIA